MSSSIRTLLTVATFSLGLAAAHGATLDETFESNGSTSQVSQYLRTVNMGEAQQALRRHLARFKVGDHVSYPPYDLQGILLSIAPDGRMARVRWLGESRQARFANMYDGQRSDLTKLNKVYVASSCASLFD